jgi:two-component system, cell cycle sensor histidine kinase and response regulator CckA
MPETLPLTGDTSLAAADAQLRAAHERLERSERQYRELLESLNEIVWAIDAAGVLTYLSPNAAQHGYRIEDLVGQPFDCIVHPEDLGSVTQALEHARNGAPVRIEYRAVDGGGAIHSVRSSFRAVFEDGVLAGFQGVLADITEQRRAEEQLRASQRLEAVGRLAGGIAHDFNNLLVVINGYAELAMQRLATADPLHQDLTEIFQAGTRAAALTQKLLAFSRRQLLRPAVLNINDAITGTASMLRRIIGEDVEFELELDGSLPSVCIDAAQLEHALMNLVLNARDAMPGGGRIRIRTAREESGIDSAVVLSVEDTGHGMDEVTRARIFDPFFTTKPIGQGTGLGLPMVYGFVKQSGGSLHVRTAPGQGSTFSLVFPSGVGSDDAGRAPLDPSVQRGRERVLVVEDEDNVRELLRRQLDSAGYQAVLAARAEEALRVLEDPAQRIDLLLTDIVMPTMRGPELARRAVMLRPGLRVLYMTGYPNTSVTGDTSPTAPPNVIWKPFSAADLTTAVRGALGTR